MRNINISNEKKRDSFVKLDFVIPKRTWQYLTPDKQKTHTFKIIKYTDKETLINLKEKYCEGNDLANALIDGDPEINLEMTGRFLKQISKVLVSPKQKIVHHVTIREIKFNPKNEPIEEKIPEEVPSNIAIEGKPLVWTGKFIPKNEAIKKFIFVRKYQLKHTSGLTFDFLYDMAKQLDEKKALMLIGSDAKGAPLILTHNGKPYRGFLEGRIQEDKYMLILHLSNIELKGISND
jgi:hypothetical protein